MPQISLSIASPPPCEHTQSFHLEKNGLVCSSFLRSHYSGLWRSQHNTVLCSFSPLLRNGLYHCSIPESFLSLGYSAWAMSLIGHFVREEWGGNGNKMVCSHLFRGHHCSHQHLNPTEVQFQFPFSAMEKAVLTTHISLCQNISLTRQLWTVWEPHHQLAAAEHSSHYFKIKMARASWEGQDTGQGPNWKEKR